MGFEDAVRAALRVKLLNRREVQRIADAVIRDPEEHTTFGADGAVRSIQAADLTLPEEELERLWTPMHLERLARTYWKYLSRVSLGLFRVAYTPTERTVVLISRPFVLLRFHAPEYFLDADRGVVRWRIRDGLLVAQEGREADGYLEIDVQRCADEAPGRARRARRGGDRELLSGDRLPHRALVLRQHAVAHPRAGHPRVPALARAARAGGVGGRPLRRAPAGDGAARVAAARHRRRHAVGGAGRHRGRWSCSSARARRAPPLALEATRSARAACGGRGATGCAGPSPSATA